MIVNWNPLDHPRNRLGEFRRVLSGLKVGDKVRMPGGVTVELRQRGGRGHKELEISSPLAKTPTSRLPASSVEKAAQRALNVSAQTPHAQTIGGKEATTYSKFRSEEVKARQADPTFFDHDPEDEEDLLTRPTHGDVEDNYSALDDLTSEAKAAQSEIEDVRGRGWTAEEDDKIQWADDILERAPKAMAEIDKLPEEVFEQRIHRAAARRRLKDAAKERGKPLGDYLADRKFEAIKDIDLRGTHENAARDVIVGEIWPQSRGFDRVAVEKASGELGKAITAKNDRIRRASFTEDMETGDLYLTDLDAHADGRLHPESPDFEDIQADPAVLAALKKMTTAGEGTGDIRIPKPPPESPGGASAREYGIAQSNFREAEMEYLSATVYGDGDKPAAKKKFDAARKALDDARERVMGVVADMKRTAALATMKASPGTTGKLRARENLSFESGPREARQGVRLLKGQEIEVVGDAGNRWIVRTDTGQLGEIGKTAADGSLSADFRPAPPQSPGTAPDRNEAIARIKTALKERSGKTWSVTGGRGTAWGWITITAPPKRREKFGYMSEADRAELGELLGLDGPAHSQGVSIAAGTDYRTEYVDRAEGRRPSAHGTPYWD